MSSELRKSLESIQSMLSQNPSPMTATSLSSRIHRASLESGGGGGLLNDDGRHRGEFGQSPLSSSSNHRNSQSHHHHHHDDARGGSLDGGREQQRSSSSSSSSVSFQLAGASAAAAAAGGGGGGMMMGMMGSPPSSLAPIVEPRISSGSGSYGSHHASLSPQQQQQQQSDHRDSLSYTPFNHLESSSGGMTITQQQHHHQSQGGGGGGGGATAFQNNINHDNEMVGFGPSSSAIGSPHSAFSTVNSKKLSSAAAFSCDPPPFGSSHHHHHHSRRETSLLVSPVSQQSSLLHSRSPQSEMSATGGGGGFGSTSSPSGGTATTPSSTAASARSDHHAVTHHGPTGTPLVASNNAVTSTTASRHGKNDSTAPSSTTAGLTIHTNLHPTTNNNNGRDPTPYHYRSNPSNTSPPYYNSSQEDDTTKKTEKKAISDASSSISSSRSGRDPPAKSPFPTSITSTTSGSGSDGGFLITSKSTPNVHSHRYQNTKDHHHHVHHSTEEHELSMIEEDESLAAAAAGGGEDNQSLVSNVTGSTFVRTPIGRKLHTAGGNGHSTAAGGHHSHYSTSHHHTTTHTPRSQQKQHHHLVRTPGSTTSTILNNATPSTSQLLHRPSLAMRESLAHLATTTSHALEEIWDDVGVSPDERANQLADLVERISDLCESKVRDEDLVRMQFRKEIDAARVEWEDLCGSLRLEKEEDPVAKMRRDPSAKDLDGSGGGGGSGSNSGGMSLQNEYEAMMGRLESLRSVKLAAVADMQLSRDKIYEAVAALHGCTIEEASATGEMQPYSDIESNLTLERRELFRSKVDEYEVNVATRTKAVVSLLLDCQSMIQELEIVPPCDEVGVGRCEDDAKIMNSLEPIEGGSSSVVDDDGQQQQQQQLRRRGQSNNYTIVSLFESSTCIGIGNSALDRITNRIAELNGEKRRRRAKLGEMGGTIGALWSMLRVPQEDQKAFTDTIRGLGLDTIRKGEAEIARLDELKSVMIGKLVREQRVTIEELWEKTNSCPAERASFNAYFHIHDDEQLTSEILVKHEEYVATLRSKLEKMQPILDLIARREAIIEDRIELEFLQKDPDRLKGRGATKRLMKEEKMRSRVTKELPKITSKLEKMLSQWYAENKLDEGQGGASDLGHFMYQGSPYLHIIQDQEEEWRTRKERGELERQRKREEERAAASSSNSAFGYTATYTKLPGKKWNPSTNAGNAGAATTASSSRPRSASTLRSGSHNNNNNMRSGSNMRGGGSARPASSSNTASSSGPNMRFGGRGPLGDVSSSRQNTSQRPPSRPRGVGGASEAGGGTMDRGKKAGGGGGRGYRPASAPRMRL